MDAQRPRRARPDDAETIRRLLLDDAARHGRSGPMPPSATSLRQAIERDELVVYVLPDGVVVYDHGEDTAIEAQPATCAGTTFITTEEGYTACPPGT